MKMYLITFLKGFTSLQISGIDEGHIIHMEIFICMTSMEIWSTIYLEFMILRLIMKNYTITK